MSLRDLHNTVLVSRGISPAAAVTDNTPFVSQIHDTLGGSIHEFFGCLGSVADADVTFTVLVEHGDAANLNDATAVPDTELLGVEAMGLDFGDDDTTFKIGYIGSKRYVRVTITPAANSGNIFLAGVWVKGGLRVSPRSTQIN